MYYNLKNIFVKIAAMIVFVILIFSPLFCYKLNLTIEILPALEILAVFYLYNYVNLRLDECFLLGLLFDQLYNLPVGTNSTALLIGIITTNLLRRWLLIKSYLTHFFILSHFCLVVFLVRVIVCYSSKVSSASAIIFILSYLTTIFSYPVFKIIADRIFYYLKTTYAKQ